MRVRVRIPMGSAVFGTPPKSSTFSPGQVMDYLQELRRLPDPGVHTYELFLKMCACLARACARACACPLLSPAVRSARLVRPACRLPWLVPSTGFWQCRASVCFCDHRDARTDMRWPGRATAGHFRGGVSFPSNVRREWPASLLMFQGNALLPF